MIRIWQYVSLMHYTRYTSYVISLTGALFVWAWLFQWSVTSSTQGMLTFGTAIGVVGGVAVWGSMLFNDYIGTTVTVCYSRVLQYILTWILLSEIAVFFGIWFVGTYAMTSSSDYLLGVIPNTALSTTYSTGAFVDYTAVLDVVNIGISTMLLVTSGMYTNHVLIGCIVGVSHPVLTLGSVLLGLLFIVNQYYELLLLGICYSSSVYACISLSIDMVHFNHVLLGITGLAIISVVVYVGYASLSTLVLIIVYWHFVDVVWIFLVRCYYLCIFV